MPYFESWERKDAVRSYWTLASGSSVSRRWLIGRSLFARGIVPRRLGREGVPGLQRQLVRQTAACCPDRRPHESYRTPFRGGCHLRRPAGLEPLGAPTPACRTLRRSARRRPAAQDLGPVGGPGTPRGRSQQPRRFLPHQPLGSRRPAPAAGGTHPPLPQGPQLRATLAHLLDRR